MFVCFTVFGLSIMTELCRWWGSNLSQGLLQPYTMCVRAHYLFPTTKHACQLQEMISTERELDTTRIQHTIIRTNEIQEGHDLSMLGIIFPPLATQRTHYACT